MTEQDKHWRWATPAVAGLGAGGSSGVGIGRLPAGSGVSGRAGKSPPGGRHSHAAHARYPALADDPADADHAGYPESADDPAFADYADFPPKADDTDHSGHPPNPRSRLERWRDFAADRLPPTLRGRWSFDRPTAIVLVVSTLLAAAMLGAWALLRAEPHELSVARTRPDQASGATSASTAFTADGYAATPRAVAEGSPAPGLPPPLPDPSGASSVLASGMAGASGVSQGAGVVVDVEGKVGRPGVRTLPNGARVIDALNAAGGALPGTDLTALNQAQVLVDGQQILVGIAPPPSPDAGTGTGSGKSGRAGGKRRGHVATPTAPVRLNSATLDDLETLPGVGPALAQRILDYRTEHGMFHGVDELQQVSGFGGQRFADIEPLVAL